MTSWVPPSMSSGGLSPFHVLSHEVGVEARCGKFVRLARPAGDACEWLADERTKLKANPGSAPLGLGARAATMTGLEEASDGRGSWNLGPGAMGPALAPARSLQLGSQRSIPPEVAFAWAAQAPRGPAPVGHAALSQWMAAVGAPGQQAPGAEVATLVWQSFLSSMCHAPDAAAPPPRVPGPLRGDATSTEELHGPSAKRARRAASHASDSPSSVEGAETEPEASMTNKPPTPRKTRPASLVRPPAAPAVGVSAQRSVVLPATPSTPTVATEPHPVVSPGVTASHGPSHAAAALILPDAIVVAPAGGCASPVVLGTSVPACATPSLPISGLGANGSFRSPNHRRKRRNVEVTSTLPGAAPPTPRAATPGCKAVAAVAAPEVRACKNCGTDHTPFWRKDKVDGRPLCNACGLYLAKNDAHRPRNLW